MRVYVCPHVQVLMETRGIRSSGAGVPGCSETIDMGARNQTEVFCKSRKPVIHNETLSLIKKKKVLESGLSG